MAETKERRAPLPAMASAPAVRMYLAATLVNEYNVSWEEASALLSPWKYGRGSDMYEFDQPTFRAILGDEVGAILWLHVRRVSKNRTPISTTSPPSTNIPPIRIAIYFFLVYGVICMTIGVLMVQLDSNMQYEGRQLATAAGIVLMLPLGVFAYQRVFTQLGSFGL